jgi:hypothetical protein
VSNYPPPALFLRLVHPLPGAPSAGQGDACALSKDLSGFSVVHGANLLCRLPNPLDFLTALPRLLVPGGLVVLVSPYSWLSQYTPREHWLG